MCKTLSILESNSKLVYWHIHKSYQWANTQLFHYITILRSSFRKEQHNLQLKDLSHQDQQNFEAVLQIINPNVIELLDEYPDAKATKYYLQVIKSILESYLNKDLNPLNGLKHISEAWFALFCVLLASVVTMPQTIHSWKTLSL